MKPRPALLLLSLFPTLLMAASLAPPPPEQTPPPPSRTTNTVDLQALLATRLPDGSFPATVAARGQDSRSWERVNLETNRFGVKVRTNSWVELETGMHYWNPAAAQWVESAPEIAITNTDAVGRGAPHQVWFSGNINSPVAVQVTTSDNQQFKLRILGIAYYDFKAQTNVLIAELKDSAGQLIATNQALYTNAFTDFRADVRYTYTKGGIEQDIILRQRPPLPEEYGMNPLTTRLLLLTEFIDPPASVQRIQHIRRGWKKATVDKALNFGTMAVGQGTAFTLGEGQPENGIPVEKLWEVLDGRTFLVEEVSFPRLVPLLRNLQAVLQPKAGAKSAFASKAPAPNTQPGAPSSVHSERPLPSAPAPGVLTSQRSKPFQDGSSVFRSLLSQARDRNQRGADRAAAPGTPGYSGQPSFHVASVMPQESGLVLDFNLVNATSMVLQGDTTYSVASNATVTLSGTNVIEGGCVVKFDRGGKISFAGDVTCLTGPYSPAVFTAKDDDSVGASIAGSTGVPTGSYANCALSLGVGGDLKYIRVLYAKEAIYCSANNYAVSHSQFMFCDVGLHSATASFTNCNVLMYQVRTNYYGTLFHGRVEHLTSDQAQILAVDPDFHYQAECFGNPTSDLTLINSITASITNGYGLPAIGINQVHDFPSGAGIFQAVGAGSHYLCGGNTNRDVGTTNLSGSLLAEIKKKTTYPPILCSNATISTDTTLAPQAQRDTDIPDLGYHYDCLDYLFSGTLITNATLTLKPGTAIGTMNPNAYSITLLNGGNLQCPGTAQAPIRIAKFSTVQEQPRPDLSTSWGSSLMLDGNAGQSRFNFTKWYELGPGPYHVSAGAGGTVALTFANCEFFGGLFFGYTPSLYVTNCLFHRVNAVVKDDGNTPTQMSFFNNLFFGGAIHYGNSFESLWLFEDNVFDNTAADESTGQPMFFDYNAYVGNADVISGLQPHDVSLSALEYRTGPLGHYYQATNTLINLGSTNADKVGLYHFTVTTNSVSGSQIKETNSLVDIGYHYVAVDGNGRPIDGSGDTIPDYLADATGDGIFNTGDLCNWTNYNSPGGLIGATGLQVFTPLK